MLPPGTLKCPRCGKRLRKKDSSEYSAQDIFLLSATTLGFVLIPIVIIIIIAVLCILLST
ncbi:MAG TPA: hypothetical protein VLM83_11495, partial [Anaerolineales bacterium]|nr:hypothetical protein [Anaerolineales bacterium]